MGKVPESLRLYVICKSMKWTHLPCGGGLYDQHPKLLDEWWVIMGIDNEVQDRKMKEMESKSKAGAKTGARGGGRRR